MRFLLMILLLALCFFIAKPIIEAIIKGAINKPTWKGIIISAILGVLPIYLVLCWFGYMGDDREPRGNGKLEI